MIARLQILPFAREGKEVHVAMADPTVLPALQIKWTWSHLAVPVTAAIQLVHLFDGMLADVIRLLDFEGEMPAG